MTGIANQPRNSKHDEFRDCPLFGRYIIEQYDRENGVPMWHSFAAESTLEKAVSLSNDCSVVAKGEALYRVRDTFTHEIVHEA